MFIENMLLAVAFVGVLHRWAWEMLRDRVAALLTPLLVLLNGGLDGLLLFAAARKRAGTSRRADALPASFTSHSGTTWRWGNAISSLLVPQRGILLGLLRGDCVHTMVVGDGRENRRGDRETRRRGENKAGKH